MFALTNQQVAINSFTPRMEKHGPENVLALDEAIKLSDVEISGFVFEALYGGSCKVKFTANFHQDGRTSGKLCQLIQETVELSLTPPSRDDEREAA